MGSDILTQQDIEDRNWDTSEYAINYEPGDFVAVLAGKAWAQNKKMRLFFDFEDGRKVLAMGQRFNKYLGFLEYPVGGTYLVTFTRRSSGVYAEKAKLLLPPTPGSTGLPTGSAGQEIDLSDIDAYNDELPFNMNTPL